VDVLAIGGFKFDGFLDPGIVEAKAMRAGGISRLTV